MDVVNNKRQENIDVIRGVLIIFVVVGHYNLGIVHDIIYLFHMPLFFIISGYLLKRKKIMDNSYIIKKTKNLIIVYLTYLVLDVVFVRRDLSFNMVIHSLWGGRCLSGVYWYITCYLCTLFLFSLLLKRFTDNKIKVIILLGGILAVVESNLSDKIPFLLAPGIPLGMDVALMALLYVGIGFFGKDMIKELLISEKKIYDKIAFILTFVLIGFCLVALRGENRLYYFDMKPIYYKELLLATMLPIAFGIIIIRSVFVITQIKMLNFIKYFLCLCGHLTLPIMFLHIPLNCLKKSIGYGLGLYMIIGIGVPIIFTMTFNKYSVMRQLFGLPQL